MKIHLFIAGTGGVGKALIAQIRNKQGFLRQSVGIDIVVNGIINSRLMRLSQQGISLDELLEEGVEWREADLSSFITFIQRLQIPNAVFADLSASPQVAASYLDLIQNGIHIVACNKIACSAPMAHYARLKSAVKERGVSFLYNTNVGAALPFLQTIRQLHEAGERIGRIEAILSGTLSYIFGRYDGTQPFAHIVREAHQLGYTEPDPRIDLQGIDVLRKLLILCREIEIPLEEKEVIKTPFLPESCLQGSLDDFYRVLLNEEESFKQCYAEAKEQGGKLKYVATYDNGKACIGLQIIFPEHLTYHLSPKDNALLIYSQNYPSPLTVVGAGAGTEVTAMGVLSDIITVANELKNSKQHGYF